MPRKWKSGKGLGGSGSGSEDVAMEAPES